MEFPQEESAEGCAPEAGARFRMVRCLGSGGMGDVWLAEDLELHRSVAVKTVRTALAQNEEIRKRIERECLLHAKVGPHPHIVTLFDRIEREGHIYLIMEYVEGETLQRLLERNGKGKPVLSVDEAVDIATQSLEALSRIHAAGIVHRDIKPANIMLAREQSGDVCAKLMDFGIARFEDAQDALTRLTTAHGSSPGTPMYMAPEQIDSKTFGRVSYATDVYAVGILLYQMLSGEPPFTGTLTEVLNGHVNRAIPPIDLKPGQTIPSVFLDVLHRALAKRPEKRFSSAQAFREALLSPESNDAATTTRVIPVSKTQAALEQCETLLESRSETPELSTPVTAQSASAGTFRPRSRLPLAIIAGLVIVVGGAALLQALKGNGKEETPQGVPPTETVGMVTSPVLPTPPPQGAGAPAENPAGQEPTRVEVSNLPPPNVELTPIEPEQAGGPEATEQAVPSEPASASGVPNAVAAVPSAPVQSASTAPPVTAQAASDGSVPTVAPVPGGEAAGQQPPDGAMNVSPAQTEPSSTVPGAAPEDAKKTYVVQPGDSLSKIASTFGIDVVDLARWNLLARPDQLKVGATLYLYKRPNLPEIEVKFDSGKSRSKTSPTSELPAKPGTPYKKTAEDLFVAPIPAEGAR